VDASKLENIELAAAGIAHDINNQLMLIVNYLSLADVESAQTAVGRCSALTSSLLSYCKGDAIAVGPVRPEIFLREFVAGISLAEGIELVLDVPEGLPVISANALALTRVLMNLVSNGCSAMAGNGTLRIAATPGTVEVSDSGPGIAAELRERIFEPFFSTKGAEGTGLGLAIVRSLMRQQSGWVRLDSEAAVGARFILEFA
jgi:signal transduction histidine kinase